MPFPKKQDKSQTKNRKPLSSYTNPRQRNRKQKSNPRKLDKQPTKYNNFIDNNQRNSNTISTSNSSATKYSIKNKEEFLRTKQNIYDKTYKSYKQKAFPQISIIQEKPSSISINQQNSLDSLNNYMIQGIKMKNSVKQNSIEQSYEEKLTQDWQLIQNQYHNIMLNSNSIQDQQYFYLLKINQIERQRKVQQERQKRVQQQKLSVKEQSTPAMMKMQNRSHQITQIQSLKKIQQKSESSQQKLLLIMQNNKNSQQKQQPSQQKSFQFHNSNQKSQNISLSNKQQQVQKILKKRISKQRQKQHEQKVLQELNEQESQKNQYQSEDDKQFVEEEQQQFIEEEQQQDQISPQQQQEQQNQAKNLEDFQKSYQQKKYYKQNQANFTINNISKIMVPKQKKKNNKNKSQENQLEIKLNQNQKEDIQKEDDQVVAMLENQLRDKNIPLISTKSENQNLLKQERDNLCLNQLEGQIHNQNNVLQHQQEQSNVNNDNFFFILERRQKWIKSLQKQEKWKNAQLLLLAKMKKILHNPYIQFAQQSDISLPL